MAFVHGSCIAIIAFIYIYVKRPTKSFYLTCGYVDMETEDIHKQLQKPLQQSGNTISV